MPTVKNLKIVKKSGTDNTYYATWDFDGGDIATDTSQNVSGGGSSSSGSIKVGDWVKVKAGSKWYNGASIASFVFNDEWQVSYISGDRAVINKNRSGSNTINSPINIKNLQKVTTKAATASLLSADAVPASDSGISSRANDSFAVGSYVKINAGAKIWTAVNGVWYETSNTVQDEYIDVVYYIGGFRTVDGRQIASIYGATPGYANVTFTIETSNLTASDPPDPSDITVDTWCWITPGATWEDMSAVSSTEREHAWRVMSIENNTWANVRDAEPGYWDKNIVKKISLRYLEAIHTDISIGDTVTIISNAVWADGSKISSDDRAKNWIVQSISGWEVTIKDVGSDTTHVIMSWDLHVEANSGVGDFTIDTWVWLSDDAAWYPESTPVDSLSKSHAWRIIGIVDSNVVRIRDAEPGYWDKNITGMILAGYCTRIVTHIDVGDEVKIKDGACWASGDMVDDDVIKNYTFQVMSISGYELTIKDLNSGGNSVIMSWDVEVVKESEEVIESERYNTLANYELMWAHYTNQGMWFHDSDATTYAISGAYDGSATYSPPEEAVKFRIQVRPVAKTHKVNDQDVPYWTGTWAMAEYSNASYWTPEVPDVPEVTLDGLTLTASLDNIDDPKAEYITFEIYDGTKLYNTSGRIQVSAAMAQYKCTVNAGGNYRVRAKAGAWNETGVIILWSDWSAFSDGAETVPTAPTGITTIRAASSTSVYLSWPAVTTAETYDIEYATSLAYLEGSNATKTITGIETTQYTVTGLESGDEYFFRVRAVNGQGHSDWTSPKSVIIGTTPAAPTTWSSASTVIVGDPLNLYWVHNAKDNSWETYAQLDMYIDDVQQDIITIESDQVDDPDDDTDTEKTHVYHFDTSKYSEGTTLKWRVRTAGITKDYGDWSVQRQVDIYARPTLSLTVTDYQGQTFETLTRFPFYISAFAGPSTQEPIGYHVLITALSAYETVDAIGLPKIVKPGDEIYSKYFDTNAQLDATLSASDLDLETGQLYNINVIVSMNSGLTAESNREFSVSWENEVYEPSVGITVDTDSYTAYLVPFCYQDGLPVENTTLSIYRREFDGTYTLIAEGLDPAKNTMVTDPHVALDYARYRVIATSTLTGAISYYDPPAYPVSSLSKETPVVIQWDEEWQNFDTASPYEAVDPLWAGSMIKIPYNIKVTENSTPDATLVNYIGRTYPVSYYGTLISSTASWSFEFDKEDKDMIYALRRLQVWRGDVYVREPEGSGYWANVSVSFNLDYDNLVVPVTLDITRVEGGM